jgi:type IV pilus assembly protein PilO
MPELTKTRHKVKIALAALAAVDVVAIVVYFSPLVGSELSRRAQLDELWRELQLKTKDVEPLRGLDKRIPVAHQQIEAFYKDRLPAEDSAISEEIGKLAAQNGVRIGSIKSVWKDPQPVGVRAVEIDADLVGNYLQLVSFINALERNQLFFLVDTVTLGGEQGGAVRLGLKMETYLKTSAA